MAAVQSNQPFTFPAPARIEALQAQAEEIKRKKANGVLQMQEQEEILHLLSAQQTNLAERMKALRNELVAMKPQQKEQKIKDEEFLRLPKVTSCMSPTYEWSLRPLGQIPSLICKGKYFRFQVRLIPLKNSIMSEELTIQLSASLTTSDTPSTPISENMTGGPILRGQVKSVLRYEPSEKTHIARFKLQITEVSSHFVNGWVRLAIQPVGSDLLDAYSMTIEPLTVENVVVRAKEKTCRKFRERELKGIPQQRVKNLLGSPNFGESHLRTY